MQISKDTKNFIEAVQQYSGNQLKHAEDCALLVDAADVHSMQSVFAELIFTAKFLHKTYGVMKRIGPSGEGYDKLTDEFESNTAKAQALIQSIADTMPTEDRSLFVRTYLEVSVPSFQALMELIQDLSWLKNYSIDTRTEE